MSRQESEKKTRGAGGRPVVDAKRRSHVGQVIRRYRLAAGMEQAALAAKLGCTKTAIGNWEPGLTRPDIDNVPRICAALKIPVTELLDMEKEAALPAEDKTLLDAYHQLDAFNQGTVRQLMDRLLFQQDHREKARLRRLYRPLCRYEEAAAAGIGAPMSDFAENETVYALETRVPHGADSIIHVNGRSMEPTFLDGNYVYVDSTASVQYGQIGIFVVNGEAFIKEYQPDGLHSHNRRYKTIRKEDGLDVRCCGRVMGVVAKEDIAQGTLAEKIEAAFSSEYECEVRP